MNRTFKFRIWDEKLKTFWYGNIRELFGHLPADVKDEHIQQYTGLKDKNGKEIYEGDIISGEFYDTEHRHAETIVSKVVFNNGAFNIAIREWHKPSLEIIGNIFENSSLLS